MMALRDARPNENQVLVGRGSPRQLPNDRIAHGSAATRVYGLDSVECQQENTQCFITDL